MAELELTRSVDDRRRYEIDGVGALRLGGVLSRGATAEAGGAEWSFVGWPRTPAPPRARRRARWARRGRRQLRLDTTAIATSATQTAMTPGSPVKTAARAKRGIEIAIDPSTT